MLAVFASAGSGGLSAGELSGWPVNSESLLFLSFVRSVCSTVCSTGSLTPSSAACTLPAFIKNTALVATETNPTDNFLKL